MSKFRILTQPLSTNAYAHDFVVKGIYYEIISSTDKTVSVSFRGDQYYYYSNEYTGSVVIPETVTYSGTTYSVISIDACAFRECSGLKTVTIPNSVTYIGSAAFEDCRGLTSVTIPNSVTKINSDTFYNCSGLTSITIPELVNTIDDYAFGYCTGLTTINFNATKCTSMGEYSYPVFIGCSNVTNLNIGDNVTYIPSYAFRGVDFATITIGTGVQKIATNAFYGNVSEKTIWLTNTPPAGYEGVLSSVNYVSNDQYTELSNVTVYPYLNSLFEVDGVKYVPVNLLEHTCDAIDCAYDSTAININIGNTVSYKGVAMTLKNINPYTFYNNDYITNCDINYSGAIGDYAFYDCDAISSVSATATTIGDYVFYSCNALGQATINAEKIGYMVFYDCSAMESVTLNNVTSIDACAFGFCNKLKTINIPNTVESSGSHVFYGCSALESVRIGTGFTAIKNYTFAGCSSLSAINIPNNVTTIGNDVFAYCTSLETVTIADRDTELSLGYNSSSSPLFADCPLKSVYIGGNITYNASSNYGYSPFYSNTTLESVVITDKETEISENEFYGCSALKSITMGDGIESIGNRAFSGCSSLDFFSIGSGLKSIGDEAFSGCIALTKLYSKTSTPPTCGNQALYDINKWNCELYVPQASISDYQAADQWMEFFLIKGIESGIDDVVADGEAVTVTSVGGNIVVSGVGNGSTVEIYNLGGQSIYCGTDTIIPMDTVGLYIVKVADKTFKVII